MCVTTYPKPSVNIVMIVAYRPGSASNTKAFFDEIQLFLELLTVLNGVHLGVIVTRLGYEIINVQADPPAISDHALISCTMAVEVSSPSHQFFKNVRNYKKWIVAYSGSRFSKVTFAVKMHILDAM
ncbi:hypothetical protein HELRODRAFT_158807 [Helobdella robusta]|uniref:Uncharacterized protein n=1 Tax=Helobdella robusta TaxID=6412 RepID=T1ENA3_HELRO|nr:hypothetical protein HELRODRAFT_158807 [Helobdella robusta]ESO12314.1 hypothetical protein HELRODRAFT_158807 [Helobdella robusta]